MANPIEEHSPSGGSGANSPSRVDRLVGRRIRLRRLLLEIELEHLANDLGLSTTLLARFEAGQERPPPSLLARIAGHLGVDVAWFFRDFSAALADPEHQADPQLPPTEQSDLAEEMFELLDQFIQVTDSTDRRAILAFIRDRVAKQRT
jgi:transcriptional regulator with XRE-family HTH domain